MLCVSDRFVLFLQEDKPVQLGRHRLGAAVAYKYPITMDGIVSTHRRSNSLFFSMVRCSFASSRAIRILGSSPALSSLSSATVCPCVIRISISVIPALKSQICALKSGIQRTAASIFGCSWLGCVRGTAGAARVGSAIFTLTFPTAFLGITTGLMTGAESVAPTSTP